MSSELYQVILACRKCFKYVEAVNAAAGAFSYSVFYADYDRGTVIFFCELGRGKSYDTGIPVFSGDDDYMSLFNVDIFQFLFCCFEYFLLYALTFAVYSGKLRSQLRRFCFILCQKKLRAFRGSFETACGIEPRCDTEAYVSCIYFLVLTPCGFNQGAQSHKLCRLKFCESYCGDFAIFSLEGNQVGNRPQCSDFYVLCICFIGFVTHFGKECLTKLKRNSCSAQVCIGIYAVVTMRVDYSDGLRQRPFGQMVVCYDYVQLSCHGFYCFNRCNSAVNGYQKRGSFCCNLLQCFCVYAVAFCVAVRNVI